MIPIPAIGNVIAGIYTWTFYERSFSYAPDTIATIGGKWGWENQADVNKSFELGGKTNHANTEDMLNDFIKTL